MSSTRIQEAIRKISGTDRMKGMDYEMCIAKDVRGEEGLCNAEPVNDPEAVIYDCMLFNDDATLKVVPKEGSVVFVVFSPQDVPYVFGVTEVEEYYLTAQKPLIIGSKDATLLEVLTDFVELAKTIKLLHPMGPTTGMDPGSIQKITQLEQKLKKLFKE